MNTRGYRNSIGDGFYHPVNQWPRQDYFGQLPKATSASLARKLKFQDPYGLSVTAVRSYNPERFIGQPSFSATFGTGKRKKKKTRKTKK